MTAPSGPSFAALAGRLPVAPVERVFISGRSFLSNCIALGAAIWVFLVGSALPSVGSTKLGVIGYAVGLVIGYVPVALASGLPSFKYGIDIVDASKATFGVRGAFIPLTCILIVSLGWASVMPAMVARGVVGMVAPVTGVGAGPQFEAAVVIVALVTIVACWAIVRSGPQFLQHINNFVGPTLIGIAVVSLGLLLRRYGWHHVWSTEVAPASALTTDRLKSLAYAVELGLVTSLAWWPYLGGLFRLVRYRAHVVTPSVIGLILIGGAFCSGVAGLAAGTMGTSDPLIWIPRLAGAKWGSVLVAVILISNIPIMGLLVYFAAVSVQQFRPLARIGWGWLLAGLLIVPSIAAFYTQTMIEHVLTVTTCVGLQFAAITGIGCVDYLLLRKQQLEVEQLFVKSSAGRYWYWGGVNWIAMLIITTGTAVYVWMYDPFTYQAQFAFRYCGASIPVMIGSAVAYWLLAKLVLIPLNRGAYRKRAQSSSDTALPRVAL